MGNVDNQNENNRGSVMSVACQMMPKIMNVQNHTYLLKEKVSVLD